MEKKQIVT